MLTDVRQEAAYITPNGKKRLETELCYLKQSKRLDIVDRLQDSWGGNDGIENSEYLSIQDELAFVDGRIRDLDNLLRCAKLIEPGACDGIIRLGHTVVVQEEGSDPESYMIIGSAEADPSAGMISNQSPLGRALLNHPVGDDVEVMTPEGPIRFRIIAVN